MGGFAGNRLVLCGDLNVARTDMDVHPKEHKPRAIGQLAQQGSQLNTLRFSRSQVWRSARVASSRSAFQKTSGRSLGGVPIIPLSRHGVKAYSKGRHENRPAAGSATLNAAESYERGTTLAACNPLGPSSTENSTFCSASNLR